jgi:hypothetical protein
LQHIRFKFVLVFVTVKLEWCYLSKSSIGLTHGSTSVLGFGTLVKSNLKLDVEAVWRTEFSLEDCGGGNERSYRWCVAACVCQGGQWPWQGLRKASAHRLPCDDFKPRARVGTGPSGIRKSTVVVFKIAPIVLCTAEQPAQKNTLETVAELVAFPKISARPTRMSRLEIITHLGAQIAKAALK